MDRKFEPLLLSTVELLNKSWGAAEPHIQRYIDNTVYGEMTLEDVYMAATQGRIFIFVVKCDEEPEPLVDLVIILEIQLYPKLPVMTIAGIAGRNLIEHGRKYWEFLRGWIYMKGARAIDANVSPAMERLARRFEFEEKSRHVRLNLNP